MRRVLASLLLTLFGLPLIAPLFAADPDSQLPACCRRAGHHRCNLVSNPETPIGPTVLAAHCPYFPIAQATPSTKHAAAPVAAKLHASMIAEFAPRVTSAQRSCDSQLHSSNPQRGPPNAALRLTPPLRLAV